MNSQNRQQTCNRSMPLKRLFGLLLVVVFLLATVFIPHSVKAAITSEDFSAKSGSLKPGLLVSVSKADPTIVELATIDNSGYLLGVVTLAARSTVNYGRSGSSNSVATTGVVSAYVTDANGEIKKGSLIGASWIDGVGMAVQASEQREVIGVAEEDFNTKTAKEYPGIKTSNGTRTLKVDSIAIRLTDPPALHVVANQTGVVGFTARLAGKQVSFTRIVSALLIFSLALIFCGIFIRNSIKDSFISIGRNPLASKSIVRSLLQVSLLSVAVILIGTAASYAVIVI